MLIHCINIMSPNVNFYYQCGDLYACGSTSYGQLGLGIIIYRKVLTKVDGGDTCGIAVSCEENHTVALDNKGHLWACGGNQSGRIGFQDTDHPHKLTKVTTCDAFFTMVSCGYNQTVALDNEGVAVVIISANWDWEIISIKMGLLKLSL